jgi:hypothetical protein
MIVVFFKIETKKRPFSVQTTAAESMDEPK